MKIMLRAAMAAVSIGGIGPAHAGEGIVAHAPLAESLGVATGAPVQGTAWAAQDGTLIRVYVANSARGTWLFAPHQDGGGTNG
jgi:hypothetical protein